MGMRTIQTGLRVGLIAIGSVALGLFAGCGDIGGGASVFDQVAGFADGSKSAADAKPSRSTSGGKDDGPQHDTNDDHGGSRGGQGTDDNSNDNSNTNSNSNGNTAGNTNSNTNSNSNGNTTGNTNTNSNTNGNTSGNTNSNTNSNSNSNGNTNPTEIRMQASLSGPGGSGHAEWRVEGSRRKFEVEIQNAAAGEYPVLLNGVQVATLTVNSLGVGEVELDSRSEPGHTPLPPNFPAAIVAGDTVAVGSIASGAF